MGWSSGLERGRRQTAVRKTSAIRATLVVMLLGCFISAQEARSESVFQTERAHSLASLVLRAPSLAGGPSGGGVSGSYAVLPGDTTQSVDIEVPEAKAHHPYKEIIGFALAAAVVAYAAITVFKPDNQGKTSGNGSGKPTPSKSPSIFFAVPLSR